MRGLRTSQLVSVAAVFNGKTPSKLEQRESGHPVLKIRDVDEFGNFRGPFGSFVDPRVAKRYESKLVCCGDTLILNAAHNAAYVASKTYRANGPSVGALATGEWLVIRPNERELDSGFAHHWINDQTTRKALRQLVNGIHLYPKDVGRLNIPLPPLPEQRRIAEVLDRAETLCAQRRQALAQLDALAESIFLDMFGDPLMNPKLWPLSKLSLLGTLDRGVSKHRPRNEPTLLGGPHPLIQTGDVANCDRYIRTFTATYSDAGLRQSRKWPAGTLCITIAANIAKTGILSFAACFPDSVVGFTPGELTTIEYVQTWLSFLQKMLEDSAPESAQKNINLAILRDLDVPLPPIELQRSYSARLEMVEQMKATQRLASEQLDALFASLQHRAFRGEL